MVTLYVPGVEAVTVKDPDDPGTTLRDVGAKVRPDVGLGVTVTFCESPPTAVTGTLNVPLPLTCGKLTLFGLAVIEKSGLTTVTGTVMLCVRVPDVPVMVTV
jgi:hypothetical protein